MFYSKQLVKNREFPDPNPCQNNNGHNDKFNKDLERYDR